MPLPSLAVMLLVCNTIVHRPAKREKLDRGYVTNVIRLTALAPDITTAILNGRQPQTLQLASIIRSTLPYDWAAQREMLGFDTAAEG